MCQVGVSIKTQQENLGEEKKKKESLELNVLSFLYLHNIGTLFTANDLFIFSHKDRLIKSL